MPRTVGVTVASVAGSVCNGWHGPATDLYPTSSVQASSGTAAATPASPTSRAAITLSSLLINTDCRLNAAKATGLQDGDPTAAANTSLQSHKQLAVRTLRSSLDHRQFLGLLGGLGRINNPQPLRHNPNFN